MSINRVKEYLKQWNMEDKIQEFETSSATVELAALALNCEPKRIAKSLSFKIEETCILIVTAGDAKVQNSKYKTEFGVKAKMLSADEVLAFVGHEVGGVCPFAIKEGVDVFLDESLKRFTTVFPACGSSNSAIELTLEELERFSNYKKWIDVCHGWQEQ